MILCLVVVQDYYYENNDQHLQEQYTDWHTLT